MARNSTLHIAIREDVKKELQEIADRYGMTTSALGAFIIGQWVDAQKKYVMPMFDVVQSGIKEVVIKSLENDGNKAGA